MSVTVQPSGGYEISNGLVAVRVPASGTTQPLAPIQGLRHRDGTWVAQGSLLHKRSWYEAPLPADPLIDRTTTLLVNTPEKVVVEVLSRFDRPEFSFSGVVIPAGEGFLRTTITVLADEPVVIGEEDSDCDVGYSLDLYPGLEPDRARYRGASASSIPFGRNADGSQYPVPYLRTDATVDLLYDRPAKVSYHAADLGDRIERPAMATWNPWIYDSGWYWQVYKDAAPMTANLFGIFAGRASRIIGCNASGMGIFNAPGPTVGVTMEINRMSADLNVSPRNRFSWCMFFGTKADLRPENEIQPIGLLLNRLSGPASAWQTLPDWTDPVAGYGGLFMGREAVDRIKAQVFDNLTEYNRLLAAEPNSSALLDYWWGNNQEWLAPLVTPIVNLAATIRDVMRYGDGIYSGPYHYYQLGQETTRAALLADQVLASPAITPQQRADVKAALALFASLMWDDDHTPWQKDAAGNFSANIGVGLGNQQDAQDSYRGFFAQFLGSDPAWQSRASQVVTNARNTLHNAVNEHGAPNASTGYLGASLSPLLNIFLQERARGGIDVFALEPRLSLLGEFLINALSPPDPRFGGLRKLVCVGDGSTSGTSLHGVLATGLRPSNPVLAARLQGAWQEQGNPHAFFFGTTLLMIDEAAAATPSGAGLASFPGYLTVQRGSESGAESAAWLLDGEWYYDHRTPDQGVLSLYALGAPLSISWGSYGGPQNANGALWRSCVQPDSQIDGWWGQPNLPLSQGNAWWSSTAVPGEFVNGSQVWRRTVKLATVASRKVLAVRDHSVLPFVWTLNLMAKDLVTPPTGSLFTPPAHPLAPLTGSLPADTYRWKCKGQWGVDFDLWIVAANPIEWAWSSWSHGSHPITEQDQFEAAQGRSFEETQYILRIRTVGQLEWAIIPYPAAAPWAGTVQDTPTGLGFTGGVTLIDLP